MELETFVGKFAFRPERAGWLGVERECFIADGRGQIVPKSPQVLKAINGTGNFGYELSACQLEERIGPCQKVVEIRGHLKSNQEYLDGLLGKMGLRCLYCQVAPENMPLDVYPDPTGRYGQITKNMPQHVLSAACRVTAVHIHVGMPNSEVALETYNRVIGHTSDLCKMGDHSEGRRMALYRQMATLNWPLPYKDWTDLLKRAKEQGFQEDPRKCWHLVRISVHGTIEFRMFDTTDNIEQVCRWAEHCQTLCKKG